MQVEAKRVNEPRGYEPKEIIITLESEEEERALFLLCSYNITAARAAIDACSLPVADKAGVETKAGAILGQIYSQMYNKGFQGK